MARSIGIRAYKGDAPQGDHVFERDIIKIGRLASAHLKLDDTKVSRIHAVIEVAQNRDEVSIIDMGSAEGTRVNGEKVSRTQLKHGDEIGLGDSRLVLVLNEKEVAAMKGEEVSDENPAEAPAAAAATPPPAADVGAAEPTAVGFAPGPMSEFSMPAEKPAASAEGAAEPPPSAEAAPTQPPAPAEEPVAAAPEPAAPAPAAPVVTQPPAPAAPMVAMTALPPIPTDPITPGNRFVEVAVHWGANALDVVRVRDEGKVTVGMGSDIDAYFPVSDAGGDEKHVLLTTGAGGDWTFHGLPGLDGVVVQGGRERPLKSAGADIPLSDDMEIRATCGMFTMVVTPVSRSRVVPVMPFVDHVAMRIALVTIFLFIGGIATLSLMPEGVHDDEDDLQANAQDIMVRLQKKEKKKDSFLEKLKAKAAAKKGKKGKKGTKKKKTKNKVPTGPAPKVVKRTNEDVVNDKMNKLFGGSNAMSAIFSADGSELQAALGAVSSNKVADAMGSGSLSMRGGGPGAGGVATGSLGIGKIGTAGRGTGNSQFGTATGNLGKRGERAVKISQGTPVIMGSLDKEIIRRVVREHMNEIKYCYERQLNTNPGLAGKVSMKWVIQGRGRVQAVSVASTTVKNTKVESCLASRIKRWRFPKPKGGIVIVNQQFVLRS